MLSGGGGQELPALVSRGQPQRGLMWGWRRGAWVNPLPLQPRLPSLRPPSTLQVSFQHEAYPAEPGPVTPGKELEEQPLSRQVFVVQELEVRDRLASSQINKFLYLHTSERMPRRTHSNMVQATPVGPPQAGHPRGVCEPGGCGGCSGRLGRGDNMDRTHPLPSAQDQSAARGPRDQPGWT